MAILAGMLVGAFMTGALTLLILGDYVRTLLWIMAVSIVGIGLLISLGATGVIGIGGNS